MPRVSHSLPDKLDLGYFLGFILLSEIYPLHTIEVVLAECGKQSERVRLLPNTALVYFIIMMSLWRDAPIEEVMRILVEQINTIADGQSLVTCPNQSSISIARTKLGPDVMESLADKILVPIADPMAPGAWFKGLRLMSFDSTTVDIPDEKRNVDYFGYPASSRGSTVFPQARVLSLIETGTHATTAAEIGPFKTCDQDLAKKIIDRDKLGPNMLLLADRNFYGYPMWSKAMSTGAKLLWRVKPYPVYPVLDAEKKLPDGSIIGAVYNSKFRNSCESIKLREINYLVKTKDKENGTIREENYRIFTNLLDPKFASAKELAHLYHERWEIETHYREYKRNIFNFSTVLRSKTPDLVKQEIWGRIILDYALRNLMASSAWRDMKDPDRLSFRNTLMIMRRKIPQLAAFPPDDER
jgi:hypothetical protein